jgi:hypothetical protein
MNLIHKATLTIDNNYIKKYIEFVSDDRDYLSFAEDISYVLFNKINLNDAAEYNIEQLLQTITRTRRYTKKRWLDVNIKNSAKVLNDVLDQATVTYNSSIIAFKLAYKVKNLDELKNDMNKAQLIIDEKLLSWCKDDNTCLGDFNFLEGKTKQQLIKAFQSDFNFIVLTYLKNVLHTNASMSMPMVMSDLPVDISGRRKIPVSDMNCVTIVVNNKEMTYYLDVEQFKDTQISTFVTAKYIQQYCLDNAFKHINALDKKILSCILSKRKSDFFETNKITIDISDIVKSVFSSDGSKNYKTVRASIDKMESIDMQYTIKGKIGLKSRIFTEVVENESELVKTNKSSNIVTISVSTLIVLELMSKQTITIYGEQISGISPEAFSLVCSLQGRRMKQHSENNDILDDILPYSFFQVRFRLGDKRKKRNLGALKLLFEELQRNKILIEKFSQVADNFSIKYYPMTAKEIKNFDDNGTQTYLLPLEV